MLLRVLFTLSLLWIVLDTSAQTTGRIAGRVTDAASGEYLPGAHVTLEGTTLGAATDLEGRYRLVGSTMSSSGGRVARRAPLAALRYALPESNGAERPKTSTPSPLRSRSSRARS